MEINLKVNKKRRSSIDLNIHNSKFFSSKLNAPVLDTLNTDRRISVSTVDTFDLPRNPISLMDIPDECSIDFTQNQS